MFYDNLKAICDEQGVKITPIVNECGGAKGSISNWKKGASPNSDIVARLAVRLNVSTDLLIFGKDKATSNEVVHIDNQSPTITNSSNIEVNGIKHGNTNNTYVLQENAKELLRVFESLPTKEQIRLLNIVYDYEEQYRKSHT